MARSPIRNWLEYLTFRVLINPLEWLPFRAAFALARAYFGVLRRVVGRLDRVGRENLIAAGYPATEEILDGMWRSIARMMVVVAKLPQRHRSTVGEWIEYEGLHHYEELKRQGRGILFATGHLGNWELSAVAHAWLTEPMHVVVRPLDNGLLDDWVMRRRSLGGNRIYPKGDATRSIVKALKRNEPVGILVDQNYAGSDAVRVDFFGRPASAQPAFARLAAHTGAGVIPGFAVWDESRKKYVLHFQAPVALTGDVAQDTQRVQAAIEQAIRLHPDQWLWIHRRWKTVPPEPKHEKFV